MADQEKEILEEEIKEEGQSPKEQPGEDIQSQVWKSPECMTFDPCGGCALLMACG